MNLQMIKLIKILSFIFLKIFIWWEYFDFQKMKYNVM